MTKEQKDAIYWHLHRLEVYIKASVGRDFDTHDCNAMHSLGFIQGTIDLLIQLDKQEPRVCEHSGVELDK